MAARDATSGIGLIFPGSRSTQPVAGQSGTWTLPNLYEGIDAVFYRNNGEAEYDFVVAPHSDPSRIRIGFSGVAIGLNLQGDIELRSGKLFLRHRRPVAYQMVDGRRNPIACHYLLGGDGQVSIELGEYDASRELIIDPVLTATYSPGGGGEGTQTETTAIATDAAGYTYLAGTTAWRNFPVTPGPLSAYHGGDVFVQKLAPRTNAVVWSVLVGGSNNETSAGIAVDPQGSVYVSGYTESPDFPTTASSQNAHAPKIGEPDIFVFKLNPQGTALIYSTLIGGTGDNIASSLALTSDLRAVVGGSTNAPDFPVTANAVQGYFSFQSLPTNRDAVVARLTNAGIVDYATYLGGPGDDFATGVGAGPTGDIFVAGIAGPFFPTLASSFAPQADHGGFVVRLDGATGQFVYSTYIRGVSLGDLVAFPKVALQIDSLQNAYVAGPAEFVFPTTPGAFQADVNNDSRTAFLLELDPTGRNLIFSTLIGGSSDEFATALTLTGDSITIAGDTNSFDFPVTDQSMSICNAIAIPSEFYTLYSTFVASFDHTGKLLTSAEFSNCDDERVYAIGGTSQSLLMAIGPESSYTFSLDTMDLTAAIPVQIAAVVDAAALEIGPSAPLQLITIFGKGLGPKGGLAANPSGGNFPTTLGGTKVTFDGIPAPLLFVSDIQIDAVVPSVSQGTSGSLFVASSSGTSELFTTWVVSGVPSIFSADGTGTGQGAILNQDGTLNSPSNPAARGSVVSIFGTGGGLTTPSTPDGQIVLGAAPLTNGQYLAVQMGSAFAEVIYAGAAPDLVTGVMQVNAQVPASINPSPSVPLFIRLDGYISQSGLTLAVK
jgi:uncharacterized protein (TIGR03437 family)